MIIVGTVVGKRVKYRTVLQLAMACAFIGGVLPFVWHGSFAAVLISRAVFGLGIGGIGCRNALIIVSFEPENRAKYIGIGIFLSNVCGVCMQFVSGWLADINVWYAFLVYAIALVPFVLITLFLREPEYESEANTAREKITVAPRVWLYVIIGLLWCILGYSIMTNMSSFVQMRGLGDAGVSGIILSLYTLGGALGGAAASKLYRSLKRFFVPFAFAVAAAGEALVLVGTNIPLVAIGTALAGFAWFALDTYLISFTGAVSTPASTPLCTSIVLAATQVGVFLSSYACAALGLAFTNTVVASKYMAITGFGICAVVFSVWDVRPQSMR